MNKKLIEICFNLTDKKKIKNEEFNTDGTLILESFIVDENQYEYFMKNNLNKIIYSIINDFNNLNKGLNITEKIKQNDIFIRITDSIKNIDFEFINSKGEIK